MTGDVLLCSSGLFLPSDNHILDHASSLAGIRCRIVQGRYDMACPPVSAWDLHRALPGSEIRIVPDAGHSATEPGLVRELVRATEDFKNSGLPLAHFELENAC